MQDGAPSARSHPPQVSRWLDSAGLTSHRKDSGMQVLVARRGKPAREDKGPHASQAAPTLKNIQAFLSSPCTARAQVLVASEGEVAEEDEGVEDDVGAARKAVRRTQGSLAAMSGASGLVSILPHHTCV